MQDIANFFLDLFQPFLPQAKRSEAKNIVMPACIAGANIQTFLIDPLSVFEANLPEGTISFLQLDLILI